MRAIKLAEALRDAGDILGAAAIITQVCRLFPYLPYGWRERAFLRQRVGDGEGAAHDFARALAAEPGNLFTLIKAVRHLAGLGRIDAAQACLDAFAPCGAVAREEVECLGQLLAYMRLYPARPAIDMAMAVRATPRYLGAAAVEARIAAALAQRQPFSLIRLGDGEGAWISDPDEAGGRFHSLCRRNRRHILRTWFGSEALLDDEGFLALRERFLTTIPAATIVGVTYPERVKHEYELASPEGVPCCTNVLRHVLPRLARGTPFFCTHDIHLDLHLSGGLHRLMTAGRPIGLISCHPGLAAALGRLPGVRVAAALLVPEEKRFAAVIGATGTRAMHYPDVFARTLARLRVHDWTGMLWLVAAGYLGKLYCHEIAAHGGVAIDIGSIADGWSGRATRPGLSDLARYSLQARPSCIATTG